MHFVLTLNGFFDTVLPLLQHGISDHDIIVPEMDAHTALFHRFAAYAMGARDLLNEKENVSLCWIGLRVHTIYTALSQGVSAGFEGIICKNHCRRLGLSDVTNDRIVALYADYCGDVHPKLRACIKMLPNLRLLAVTRVRMHLGLCKCTR